MRDFKHLESFKEVIERHFDHHKMSELGWRFNFDEAKKRLGCCNHNKKLITFSLPYVMINEVEHMEDTVLHEIAHALVGPFHQHDWMWRCKANMIGAIPRACSSDPRIKEPPGPYMMKCNCRTHYFHRHTVLKNRYTCIHCRKSCQPYVNMEYSKC